MTSFVGSDWVGPILQAVPVGQAIAEAMTIANPGLRISNRGAYLTVLGRGSCKVSTRLVAARLGRPFHLPGDLEAVMVSFRGNLRIEGETVVWSQGEAASREV